MTTPTTTDDGITEEQFRARREGELAAHAYREKRLPEINALPGGAAHAKGMLHLTMEIRALALTSGESLEDVLAKVDAEIEKAAAQG